jgi:hypothetical protein
VAKSRKNVAEAESDAAEEKHDVELAKVKLEVNQAELKKAKLRFAPNETKQEIAPSKVPQG